MVDFNFYETEYHGGTVKIDDWPYYEARAAEKLAQYKRTYTVTAPEEKAEALAVCAMADVMATADMIASGGGAVASASIGSVSVSYGAKPMEAVDITPRGREKELYRTAQIYLDICRGVG